MKKSHAGRIASIVLLASLITACSGNNAAPPMVSSADQAPDTAHTQALMPSNPSLATYYFYCSGIGLGTITAVVVANSQDDAFHVTQVAGGNGTVKPGDMLLVYAYTPPDKYPNSNPGFEKNGQTTYTCPSFSGRRQLFGTVSFVIRGAQSASRAPESMHAQAIMPSQVGVVPSYFYCDEIGLGTITAVVVATSKGDAFHVTDVVGGNGTVRAGDMLLAIAYTNPQVTHTNPGFEKNGLTTYTCPSFSGRRQVLGSVTFVVRR